MKTFSRLIATLLLSTLVVGVFAEELPEQSWKEVKALRGIPTQSGMTVPSLYVFFDANCPWCAKLWFLQVEGKRFSDVPAIWIPVSYLGKDSVGKGAALLRAANKTGLEQNFTKFNYDWHHGAIPPVVATEAESRALAKAKAVWLKLGGGTPMFVYRKGNGTLERLVGLDADKVNDIARSIAPATLSTFPQTTR